MKTIILATDFSPSSLNAAHYAADMASKIYADLLLLHIYQLPVSYNEMPVPVDLDEMTGDVEKLLGELKEQLVLRSAGKINIKTMVRTGTFFYSELKLICEYVNPYVVIMGSQGKTASERLFFGGHTVHSMKHLKWPLISVPPCSSFSAIKKIGFACDFNKVVDVAPIDEIKVLVRDFNAELHVLNISKNDHFTPETVYETGLLQEMLLELKPDYHFITCKNIDEGIMNFAQANRIDLLMVLPRRHDLLSNFLHRSHTKQFVLHSHVPVLALHQ